MKVLAGESWLMIVRWVWRCLFYIAIALVVLYVVGARLTLDGRPGDPTPTPTAVAHAHRTPRPPRVVDTPTPVPNLEPDYWRSNQAATGGTPWVLIVGMVVLGAGLFAVGIGLGQRSRERWTATPSPAGRLPTVAEARPVTGSGGKTVVADPPKTDPSTTTNGRSPA